MASLEPPLYQREDILNLKFDTHEEAYNFYNMYAKVKGFSERNNNVYRNKKSGKVISRDWLCSKSGERQEKYLNMEGRKREPRRLTRVGCPAMFSIKLDKNLNKYVVSDFEEIHNHLFIGQGGVPFLRSHRKLKISDKFMANSMHEIGMQTSHIMDFMVQQARTYENVGYIAKDLRNHFTSERALQTADGDAECVLEYLSAKRSSDPMFYFDYAVDSHGKLSNLFWADSTSRNDYVVFGDLLIFDATYSTNAYGKPFVILQGVNNHFNTIVYGCALLVSETMESYKWVLEKILKAMYGKKPVSVITDGDLAMRGAIEAVLGGARHRLCSWHLERNAKNNINKPNFVYHFGNCMKMKSSIDEFDQAWQQLVKGYAVEDKKWIIDMYKNRHLWAATYLRGQFFAGSTSTQRCEGMNSYLKRFLKRRLKLYEFVKAYDRALGRLRTIEIKASTDCGNSSPVLSTKIQNIEKHAGDIYTNRLFLKFRLEIEDEQLLILERRVDGDGVRTYYFSKYTDPGTEWRVSYSHSNHEMHCSCLLLEEFGLPCSHMISVMKSERLKNIPDACIISRWTKNAKNNPFHGRNSDPEWITQQTRFGALSSMCNIMSFHASHVPQGYDELLPEVTKWATRMKALYLQNRGGQGNGEPSSYNSSFGVGDPSVIRAKGTHPNEKSKFKKARRCGWCRKTGHRKDKCTVFKNYAPPPQETRENVDGETGFGFENDYADDFDSEDNVEYAGDPGMATFHLEDETESESWSSKNNEDPSNNFMNSEGHSFSYQPDINNGVFNSNSVASSSSVHAKGGGYAPTSQYQGNNYYTSLMQRFCSNPASFGPSLS